MKEYKIWRFAYESHEEIAKLPDELVLYSNDYDPSLKQKEMQHWYGITKYTEDYMELAEDHNAMALTVYTIGEEFIIWDFAGIYPLDENWPIATEPPHLPHYCYVAHRGTDVKFPAQQLRDRLEEISKMDISEDEKGKIIEDEFVPVFRYVKIHDFTPIGTLDCTVISEKDIIGDPMSRIERRKCDFEDILDRWLKEKTVESSADEFDRALHNMIEKIK